MSQPSRVIGREAVGPFRPAPRLITCEGSQHGEDRRIHVSIEFGALLRSLDGGAIFEDRLADSPLDTPVFRTHTAAPGRIYAALGDVAPGALRDVPELIDAPHVPDGGAWALKMSAVSAMSTSHDVHAPLQSRWSMSIMNHETSLSNADLVRIVQAYYSAVDALDPDRLAGTYSAEPA